MRLALQYQDGSQPSFKCLHRFLKNQVPQPNVPKNEDPAAIAIRTPKTVHLISLRCRQLKLAASHNPFPPLEPTYKNRHPARALSAPACRSASRQSRSPLSAASISAVQPRTRGASLSTPSPTWQRRRTPQAAFRTLMEAMGTRTSRMGDALQPSLRLSNLVQLLNFSTLINSKLCQQPVPPRPLPSSSRASWRAGLPRSRAPFSPCLAIASRLCGLQQSEPQPETLPDPRPSFNATGLTEFKLCI